MFAMKQILSAFHKHCWVHTGLKSSLKLSITKSVYYFHKTQDLSYKIDTIKGALTASKWHSNVSLSIEYYTAALNSVTLPGSEPLEEVKCKNSLLQQFPMKCILRGPARF